MNVKPWIQANGSNYIDILNPTVEQIRSVGVEGFAFALSNLNRFTGWVGQYSVALHSINVAQCVDEELGRPDLELPALWHDAAEAVTGDISTPMKAALCTAGREHLKRITHNLDNVIALAFGIPAISAEDHAVIKRADRMMLRAEREHFMPPIQKLDREEDWQRAYAGEVASKSFDAAVNNPSQVFHLAHLILKARGACK